MNILNKYTSKITLYGVFVLVIFIVFIFLRVYQFESRSQFTYDQVDNAWVSKNLIINHRYPLVGMTARQSSGVSIGPLYYYYIAFFYLLTNLDPIASPIAATIASFITFLVFSYVSNKIFGKWVTLIALILYSVSSYIISFDRIQWPVDFIPLFSLLVFYSLYKILMGEEKFLIFLGLFLGLSFHIHSTSVYYLLITGLTLPLFPKTRKTVLYLVGCVSIFILCLVPNIIVSFQNKYYTSGIIGFLKDSYLGIHGRRILQVAPDAFIEFEELLFWKVLSFLKYVLLPLYIIAEVYGNKRREVYIRTYLIVLWFLVPWLGFSVYRGDISNYFLAITRPIAVLVISYLIYRAYDLPSHFPKHLRSTALTVGIRITVVIIIVIFTVQNISFYNSYEMQGLDYYKKKGLMQVRNNIGNQFTYGAAETYMYYFYSYKLHHIK